ncbi:unnamed protein product, partial [Trichogramma brassicae]
HMLVPLHPLPGPAHRRQVEVRPPPPNSQRKGSRCDRCPCEDHAQLWRAQKQLTQAVCSRRRLHTPVRSPRLVHSSTNASLHTTGGVSPMMSLPACDRRPAACRLRGHICPCRHTTAGPSRGRASAALWPPPRRRKGRGTLGNAKQVAGSMGPVEEGPTDPKYQSPLPGYVALYTGDNPRWLSRRSLPQHRVEAISFTEQPLGVSSAPVRPTFPANDIGSANQLPISYLLPTCYCLAFAQARRSVVQGKTWISNARRRYKLGGQHETPGDPNSPSRLRHSGPSNDVGCGSFSSLPARSSQISDDWAGVMETMRQRFCFKKQLMDVFGPQRTQREPGFATALATILIARALVLATILVAFANAVRRPLRLLEIRITTLAYIEISYLLFISIYCNGTTRPDHPRATLPTHSREEERCEQVGDGERRRRRANRARVMPHRCPSRGHTRVLERERSTQRRKSVRYLIPAEIHRFDIFMLASRSAATIASSFTNHVAATPGAVHAWQQPKPRPVQRRARHRPDVIVIKAKDASKYEEILRSLKSDPTLQQKVGSSVNNIRRSAAGALMLQLKKDVENASDLGEELGKVLGTAATASALLHTSTIEIKDLDECATKEEVTAALDALLGVPVSKRDPVKSLRKAYAGTQAAVVALPDDLAATALKLGDVWIGWVNCRIRARKKATAARALVTWPLAARVPTARSSATDAAKRATKQRTAKANQRAFSAENEELTTIVTRPQARAALWPGRSPRTADDENPPAQAQSLKLRIDVAILCEQCKNLAPPNTWLADANGQAAIWVHAGIPVQERPARVHPYFARASIVLDSLALLDMVLLNTGDVPTFNGRQGSSIVDLTFVCETLTPRVLSWTVSGLYTHSDHKAIVFEIEDDGASSRPSTPRSCKWNARTLDVDRFSAVVSGASVAPGIAEDMASSLMSIITGCM